MSSTCALQYAQTILLKIHNNSWPGKEREMCMENVIDSYLVYMKTRK